MIYDMIFYLTFHKSTNKNEVGYRTCQEVFATLTEVFSVLFPQL